MIENPKIVLIVEDDEAISLVVKETLEADGYHVKTANNGFEALLLIQEEGLPNLILLDMKMPVMDGWQFATEFNLRHAGKIPIVVMTAAGDAARRAADIQAVACLGKPFDLEDLQATVKEYSR